MAWLKKGHPTHWDSELFFSPQKTHFTGATDSVVDLRLALLCSAF